MYKVNQNYAGNWTFFKDASHNSVRQHFVTNYDERFVIDSLNPAEDCHRESVMPLLDEVRINLHRIATKRSAFVSTNDHSDTVWSIKNQRLGYELYFMLKPNLKLNELQIMNPQINIRIFNIQLTFSPTVPEHLFDVSLKSFF